MPYVGKQPLAGDFKKLGALTASATATYALTYNSAAFTPANAESLICLLYTSPSPRDRTRSRMPSSA